MGHAMKMPPKGKAVEIPKGVYGPQSRLNGMDINGQIYQVGHTHHSSTQKFREGWDRIWGDKDEVE